MKKLFVLNCVCLVFLFVVSCGESSNSGEAGGGPKCGDGKVEGNEVCDGNVPCWQAGHFYPELEAVCNSDCTAYDTSKCIKRDPSDNCGNFQIDSGEACEQGNTKPCTELPGNYTQGEADCRRDCRGWNLENCSTGGKYRSCAQILECVKVCADDSCKNACKEAGTDQGASLFADLEKCAASCGGVTDNNCLTNNCYTEFYACNPSLRCGNGVIDDGEICEKKETKPCQELNSAEKEYQPINEAVCNSECKGWDTYSCVDINALTCYQVYECISECNDSACENECLSKTWQEARNKYDKMKACLTQNCPVVTDECINEFCKFQTDACKTHLTCGNGVIDQYEVCDNKAFNMDDQFIDCGDIKDENGESMYEPETGFAFCGTNCTAFEVDECYRFCSCSEVKTCIEQECGGYPKSNAENTEEKVNCMETCESWGSKIGKGESAGYRQLIESCCEQDQQGNPTKCGWDSSTCIQNAPSSANATCGTEDNAKCPY